MKHWACLCGFREDTDSEKPPLCIQCNADMYGYVPPPWQPIGRLIRPIVERAIKARRGRR